MNYKRRSTETVEAITFDELVAFGISQGATIHHGMPWSFTYKGVHVTHESNDCYLVGSERFERGEMLVTPNTSGCVPTAWSMEEFNQDYEPVIELPDWAKRKAMEEGHANRL